MLLKIKKILLLSVLGIVIGASGAYATDNVLQAVQVNGMNDTYDIVLKSDDVAEMQKTIQAPNKMIITLKGIRASKTINTIYNNTSSVDSVVVEPINDDMVKISIQADNVENAKVDFDSLKTPLGITGGTGSTNKAPQANSNEITLNEPIRAYSPIYNRDDEDGLNDSGVNISSGILYYVKKLAHRNNMLLMITGLLFTILVASGFKLIKGKDSDIKIGLKQSLEDRETEMYRDLSVSDMIDTNLGMNRTMQSPQMPSANAGYGLKSYQNAGRSPYATSELPRKKFGSMPMQPQSGIQNNTKQSSMQSLRSSYSQTPSMQQQAVKKNYAFANSTMQNTIKKPATMPKANNQKVANIDSMKFLESMTKIYEKNGRADLANGLKSNMKKAKMNLV